jgi:hypothetical protein
VWTESSRYWRIEASIELGGRRQEERQYTYLGGGDSRREGSIYSRGKGRRQGREAVYIYGRGRQHEGRKYIF